MVGPITNLLRNPEAATREQRGEVTQVARRSDDGAWRFVSFQMTPQGDQVWGALPSEQVAGRGARAHEDRTIPRRRRPDPARPRRRRHASPTSPASPGVGTSLTAILPRLAELRAAILAARASCIRSTDVVLEAPIDEPQKYLGIGMNYREHAEEARQPASRSPTSQLWFNKQVSCIVGPYDDIVQARGLRRSSTTRSSSAS